MREENAVTDGRIRRVLFEFVRPALRGPVHPFDDVAAFHVHGEPVEAAAAFAARYEPFRVGEAFGTAWDTTWFRLRGTVPPEWRDTEVALAFQVGNAGETGFGAESLVWRDGRPVQGLSPNHREHVITPKARGGETVELFVEAAANPPSPFGANPWPMLMPDPGGQPLFTLARAELTVRDNDFAAFWHDFRILVELLGELPPGDPRAERVRAALSRACDALNLRDVRGTYEQARPILAAELAQRAAPGVHRTSIAGHAHLDTAWLWPLRETVRKCARTFSTALALMDEYPEYRFVVSQAQHLAWMRDRYPDLWERMKARIAEGRVEPTGSMWVEADCNIPSGESLVRQIVHGKRFYRDELGIDTEDVWLPDVFGYSAALPQIMRRAGVRFFLTQKLSWNQYNVLPHHTFLWEGIDGSRVFTHFPPSDTYGGQVNARELRFGVSNFKDHDRATRSLYLFGWGDGGGGPTASMLESARRYADLDGLPHLAMEGPRAFFTAAEADARDPAVWVGELYLELHRGTYTSQAAVKRGNRHGELALRDAELWGALSPSGYDRDALDGAWKTLLLHQFHDIIPGSGIHWVYEDSRRAHAEIAQVAGAASERATAELARLADTSGLRHPIVVFNSLSHERCGVVTVDAHAGTIVAVAPDGSRSPMQRTPDGRAVFLARAPACGITAYDLVDGDAPAVDAELAATERGLANARLRVELDEHGRLASVFDRTAQREVLSAPGNVFQLHPDYPNFYDAWDVDRFYLNQVEDLTGVDSISVVENGPIRASVEVTRSFGASRIVQRTSLVAGSPVVQFDTEVDWHETNQFLKVAFPVTVRSPRATYEIQYGHVERPTHANTSWDLARFEVCAHKWADLTEPGYGVALLNDCKYGYDISGNVIRLSLLRAPTWPDPVADRGHHRFTYQLFPHAGDLRDAGVIDAGYDLNVALRAVPVEPASGPLPRSVSLLSVDAPNVVVEAVKLPDDPAGGSFDGSFDGATDGAGDGSLVVRGYEAWGRRGPVALRAPWPLASAARADLLEREEAGLAVDGDRVRLDVSPFEIFTLLLRPAHDAS
ncbi:MAG: alpha-mannosidase [Actinobacteria bacterium]|nr:alpha-mannosidase [Actinomycetota bacterium]